jgi:mannitol operon transcriptional antiterminator
VAHMVCAGDIVTLTTRQCAVLAELLLADKAVAVAEIATRLEITPRKVRYDLRAIRSWLEARGIRLVKRPHYGILVGAASEVRMDLRAELTRYSQHRPVLSPAERLHVLILSLLKGSEPVLAKQLQSALGVSYPTVLSDMGKARQWLEGYNLQLVARRHFGFLAVGRETDRREALIGSLLETLDESLMAACTEPNSKLEARIKEQSGLPYGPREFAAGLELDFGRELAEVLEGLLLQQFADTARISLVLCLAILVKRVQQGDMVELTCGQLESLRKHEEFDVAVIAANRITQRFGVILTEQEVGYIAMQLLGASTRRPPSATAAEHEAQGIDAEVSDIVGSFVANASIYLQPCLMIDQQLTRNLEFHLQRALNRLRFGLAIRNPLLTDIKNHYPYIFQVAERASAALESHLGKRIPEEEIGYLAMHLGAAMERFRSPFKARRRVLVVCGEGVATAWLLVSRIQTEFPDIEVIGVTPVSEASEEDALANDIVAIISTVPMAMASVPVVVVSPLLPAEDVSNLRATLEVTTAAPRRPMRSRDMPGASLADLLNSETIALRVAADTWTDVVDAAGGLLLATGAIEPEYVEAMKQLIEQHGPYVVIMPEVALLHANPETGVHRMGMSMVTLSKAVCFGHLRNDPVSIAVAMATIDDHRHWRALKQLVDLLANRDSLRQIKNATTKAEVLHVISALAPLTRPISKILSQ